MPLPPAGDAARNLPQHLHGLRVGSGGANRISAGPLSPEPASITTAVMTGRLPAATKCFSDPDTSTAVSGQEAGVLRNPYHAFCLFLTGSESAVCGLRIFTGRSHPAVICPGCLFPAVSGLDSRLRAPPIRAASPPAAAGASPFSSDAGVSFNGGDDDGSYLDDTPDDDAAAA